MAFEHFDKIAALVEGDHVRATADIKNTYSTERPTVPAGTVMRIDFVCQRADSFYAKADIDGQIVKANIPCSEFHKIEIPEIATA